jgi:dUTP pyrophosphatase
MILKVARAPGYTGPLPAYATAGAAGLDLPVSVTRSLDRYHIERIPTGIMVEIPAGHLGLITARSGAAKSGILVVPGIIDEDYRGEVQIQAYALGSVYVSAGMSFAQLLVIPVARCEVVEVAAADLTPDRPRSWRLRLDGYVMNSHPTGQPMNAPIDLNGPPLCVE